MPNKHDEHDATAGGGRTDEVTVQPTERTPDAPSEATERVHHERRREQRKIDDFNQDRDPMSEDED